MVTAGGDGGVARRWAGVGPAAGKVSWLTPEIVPRAARMAASLTARPPGGRVCATGGRLPTVWVMNDLVTTTEDLNLPLVERYQAGRAAAAKLREGAGRDAAALRLQVGAGEDAAVLLVKELVGLVLDKVRREAIQRREIGWFERHLDDLRGDATEWLLRELEGFRAGEGSVAAFVATRAAWEASDLLYKYSQDGGRLERSWYQIRSASAACVERLRGVLGRTPSRAEIADAVLSDARESLTARLLDKDPSLATRPDELTRKVHDRLSRDGVIAAVANLDAIMDLGAADVRFDASVTFDGDYSTTVGDLTPGDRDVSDSLARTSRSGDVLEDLYAVALGDAQWARGALAGRHGLLGVVEGDESLSGVRRGGEDSDRRMLTVPRLAELTGRDRVEIRRTLAAVPARLTAPHAQFAHLAELQLIDAAVSDLGVYRRADFVDA